MYALLMCLYMYTFHGPGMCSCTFWNSIVWGSRWTILNSCLIQKHNYWFGVYTLSTPRCCSVYKAPHPPLLLVGHLLALGAGRIQHSSWGQVCAWDGDFHFLFRVLLLKCLTQNQSLSPFSHAHSLSLVALWSFWASLWDMCMFSWRRSGPSSTTALVYWRPRCSCACVYEDAHLRLYLGEEINAEFNLPTRRPFRPSMSYTYTLPLSPFSNLSCSQNLVDPSRQPQYEACTNPPPLPL